MDFWISQWISGFQLGFLDFTVDFWISVWISVDGVRDFFRDGPLALSTRSCWEGAMENSAPNHGGTFSHIHECSFRLSGHASSAHRKPDSNSSPSITSCSLTKTVGRNCSIYPRFISMLQEDFRLANKFPEVSTLAGPL